MRRIRYLVPSLLAAGFGHGDPAQALYVRTVSGPGDDPYRSTLLDVFRQDHTVILADHRSHRSHSSHSSHRSGYGGGGHYSHTSHRSSSGGEYYGGTAAPARPIFTPPPVRSESTPPTTSQPLFSPAERAEPVEAAPKTLSGRTKRFAAIVRRVQIALLARQLYAGPIDGIVGSGLRAALRKFQAQRSLAVTGTITHQTLDALMVSSDYAAFTSRGPGP